MQNLTHYFKGKKWQDIIKISDEDLEKLGITDHITRSTLGAHLWVIQVDH
ncbi:19191_t:CDS:1, partial [Racocetra fulgida]